MKNKRILIKLSGQALSGNENDAKYSEEVLHSIADQILQLKKQGAEVALVVGGGNLFRGRDMTGALAVKRTTADYVGMLATVQNSLVLRDYFESLGMETRVSSAIAMRQVCEELSQAEVDAELHAGRIVIFAAGLGAPYFSTDSTAVQRSLEIGAEMLVMAKNNVDGIYSADPKKDPRAKKIDSLKSVEFLMQNLKVADAAAIALAQEHNLLIKVVSMKNISSVFEETIGSVIIPG